MITPEVAGDLAVAGPRGPGFVRRDKGSVYAKQTMRRASPLAHYLADVRIGVFQCGADQAHAAGVVILIEYRNPAKVARRPGEIDADESGHLVSVTLSFERVQCTCPCTLMNVLARHADSGLG